MFVFTYDESSAAYFDKDTSNLTIFEGEISINLTIYRFVCINKIVDKSNSIACW